MFVTVYSTQMSINRRTDKKKKTVVYSYNRILHSNKKERTTDICSKVDESQEHHVEQKKLHLKE